MEKENNLKKGCGKPVSSYFYPHFKCGEKDNRGTIYYCRRCEDKLARDL